MRHITSKVGALAILLLLSRYSMGAPAPEQQEVNLNSMTAAELEKAGDEARGQKNYRQAIDYLRAAVRKDRKNSVLYNKLGMAELKNDQLGAARFDFERAAKYDAKNAEAVNNIGAVEYMKKNYNSAVKYFKKAVALEENRATFHVNLGAAWFSQKKIDRAMTEYVRALELDPEALQTSVRTGVAAQIASPEERAQYSYMLARIYANRGDLEGCLQCLRKAKEDGYRNLVNVYRDEEFAKLRSNPKLQEVVPPPVAK
jgi:tetratricopeptide (TPR) repeat protein